MTTPLLYHEYEIVEFKDPHWKPPANAQLIRMRTPLISGYYHAICNAFSKVYRTTEMPRVTFIDQMRAELSNALVQKVPGTSKSYYDTLYNGQLGKLATKHSRYSANNLQKEISGIDKPQAGYEQFNPVIHEYISLFFQLDIYIIDLKAKNLVYLSSPECSYKKRDSIVLFAIDGHFEPCAAVAADGTRVSVFRADNPFIEPLYKQLIDHKKK